MKLRLRKSNLFASITILILAIINITPSPSYAAETEIGRVSGVTSGGANIAEIVTYEMISYDDTNDEGTYTIRYYLEHSGKYYAQQMVPVGIYVDGTHVATFEDKVGDRVVDGKELFGSKNIVIKAGKNHVVELKDIGEGGTIVVNMRKEIYLPYKSFSVDYNDWNGTNLDNQSIEKYSNATPPSNPSRTGYTFSGWSSDGKNITSDTTITAQYNINYYPVRYLNYDGSVIKSESVAYGSNATPPSNPSRIGYTFTGWSTGSTSITSARDITAKYKINAYPIAFNSNGGSAVSAQSITYGSKVSKPTNPIRVNYKFIGWFKNVGLTQAYDFNTNIGAAGFTLYAKWNKYPTISASDKTFYQGQYTSAEWAKSIRPQSVSASDVEDGVITSKIKVIYDNVNVNVNGVYKVTYQVTDSVGNVVNKDIKVTVKFNNPPVITGKDKTFYENEYNEQQWLNTHRWAGMNATDVEDGNLKSKVKISVDTTKVKVPGTYKVTYSVTDAFKKTSTKDIKVIVKFNNPPKIAAPNKSFYENEYTSKQWKDSVIKKNISASDIEDGTITDKIQVIKDGVNPAVPGMYEVLYRVTDQYGKTSDKIGKVEVKYNNFPVITAENRKYIENEYTAKQWKDDLMLENVQATDIEDGNITKKIEVLKDNVNPQIPGFYNTTYKVTDQFGKSSEKTIETEIVFNNTPVINAKNVSFHKGEYGDGWIDEILKDVEALDAEDGDITKDIKITSNNVDPNTVGSYEVCFEISDSLGKTTTKVINVNVLENQTPTIQIIAEDRRIIEGEYTQEEWQVLRLENVLAYDFEDKDITDRIEVVEDKVETNNHGTYGVTYKVTDDYGKSISKTIKVTVEANQAPVLFVTERWFYTTDDVNTKTLLSKVMAYDDFDGTLTKSVQLVSTTVESGVEGDYEAVYSVSDSLGKESTSTAIIHIVDRGGNPVEPNPPTPPIVDDKSVYHWNDKQAAGVDIVKILENADVHSDAYQDVVFGIYVAEDIVYGGKVVLSKDSLVDIVKIDEDGHGYGKVAQAGMYYVKEIATDDQYVLDDTLYYFTFHIQGK